MTDYFVNRVEYIPHIPSSCMGCGRDNLISDAVIAQTGLTSDNLTDKETVLCLACETLMVITDEQKKALGLKATTGNKVTLRSNRQ